MFLLFYLSASVCQGATFLTWEGWSKKETSKRLFSRKLWYGCHPLHETYLIKFKFEKLCEEKTNTKADILSIIAEFLPTRGILVILFIPVCMGMVNLFSCDS